MSVIGRSRRRGVRWGRQDCLLEKVNWKDLKFFKNRVILVVICSKSRVRSAFDCMIKKGKKSNDFQAENQSLGSKNRG